MDVGGALQPMDVGGALQPMDVSAAHWVGMIEL